MHKRPSPASLWFPLRQLGLPLACLCLGTQSIIILYLPVESKTRINIGQVGSGRTAEWRGGVRQDYVVPTGLFAQMTKDLITLYLSSPKPGHTTGGSGRHGAERTAGRGEAGQNKVPTFRSPWKPTAPLALQRTVNNCSERLFASANKGNPM